MRKIKLIWDFRGPEAERTAIHHEKHLKEYINLEKVALNITGNQRVNDMHSFAFIVVAEEQMLKFRDALKPHRAEVYEN